MSELTKDKEQEFENWEKKQEYYASEDAKAIADLEAKEVMTEQEKWRSKDWVNIRGDWFNQHFRATGGRKEAFEAGADAYHRALRDTNSPVMVTGIVFGKYEREGSSYPTQ